MQFYLVILGNIAVYSLNNTVKESSSYSKNVEWSNIANIKPVGAPWSSLWGINFGIRSVITTILRFPWSFSYPRCQANVSSTPSLVMSFFYHCYKVFTQQRDGQVQHNIFLLDEYFDSDCGLLPFEMATGRNLLRCKHGHQVSQGRPR